MNRFRKIVLRELFSISKIITIFSLDFPQNYIFPGESHDFWEFIFVSKGEIIIAADTSEYLLKSGEMAFHKPNEFHNINVKCSNGASVIISTFECKSVSMQFFENKIVLLDDEEKQLLQKVLAEGQIALEIFPKNPPITGMKRKKNSPPGTEQLIKISLESLLIHIFRRRDLIFRKDRYTFSPQQYFDNKLVEDTTIFLKEKIYGNISLEDVAHHLGVSSSKIKKTFKEYKNQSIIEYFIDLKIQLAKKLITESNLNFSQISEKLGYKSIHYFSRIFKNKTSMTLSEYSHSNK